MAATLTPKNAQNMKRRGQTTCSWATGQVPSVSPRIGVSEQVVFFSRCCRKQPTKMWTCLLINMWFCCCCFWNQKSFHKKSCKEKGMVQKCVLSGHASSVICSIKTSNFGSHSYLPVSHVDSFITVAETRVSQFCFKTLHGSGWIVCPTCFFDSAFLGMVKPTIDSVILGMPAWIKKRPFCWSEGHVPVSWRWGIPWCHLQMWCGHEEQTWGDHREKWGPDMGTSMDEQN